ncbi:hypothetical protein BC833DRAFT_569344 [Globomyces pollinis-pini]|nr:hypothetical protein BC833DRAFT_569344 [Globomyces pollinis-pini]
MAKQNTIAIYTSRKQSCNTTKIVLYERMIFVGSVKNSFSWKMFPLLLEHPLQSKEIFQTVVHLRVKQTLIRLNLLLSQKNFSRLYQTLKVLNRYYYIDVYATIVTYDANG